jgi:hypothetical protein
MGYLFVVLRSYRKRWRRLADFVGNALSRAKSVVSNCTSNFTIRRRGGPWIQQHEREDLGMLWSLPSQPSLAIPKLPEQCRRM